MRRFKKELIIASILLGVLIFMGGASGMNKEEYRKNYSVESGTILKVYNRNGDIVVNSWDRDYIEVEAITKRHWWTGFLKEPRIDVTTGNEFVVRTLYSTALSEAVPVQYRIIVPKGVLVTHVETSNGDLPLTVNELSKTKFTGKFGEGSDRINIKTATGSINLKKLDSSSSIKY